MTGHLIGSALRDRALYAATLRVRFACVRRGFMPRVEQAFSLSASF